MSVLDTLITDRTQEDVDLVYALNTKGFAAMTAAEKAEYLAPMKGAYNADDLNRVGQAVAYVAGRLNGYGYSVNVTPRADWAETDIPTPEQLEAYRSDIETMRAAIAMAEDTPDAPHSMEQLTYEDANDIEKILLAADDAVTRMERSFVHSGQPYSGQIWEGLTT